MYICIRKPMGHQGITEEKMFYFCSLPNIFPSVACLLRISNYCKGKATFFHFPSGVVHCLVPFCKISKLFMSQREDHYSILNTRFIRIITWHQSLPCCWLPWEPQLHSCIHLYSRICIGKLKTLQAKDTDLVRFSAIFIRKLLFCSMCWLKNYVLIELKV